MTSIPVREHDYEPAPGIPERLPEDEYIIWQGRPKADLAARRILKVRWIAGYMTLLAGWAVVAGISDGLTLGAIAFSAGVLVLMGALLIGMLEFYAWAIARTTLYTLTNNRVIMRIGVGLTLTLNLPYAQIRSASVRHEKDGSGNIAFRLDDDTRVALFNIWPHSRAWHYSRPEPAMICVPDVQRVAQLVATELGHFEQTADADDSEKEKVAEATRKARRPAAVAGSIEDRELVAG